MRYLILFFVFLVILNVFANGDDILIVNTVQGKVSGVKLKSFMHNVEYYGFMGIPFAEPPVGDLRFLAPKPREPWNDILKADKEKPACLQYNYNIAKRQPFGVYGVEDCLYIDVFTLNLAENTDEKKPVLVFIYNEQFRNTYNKSLHYAPDFFIEEDVVVVTISHRVSLFGFLSLEDATLPGNAGLKDVVLGLEWIRDNIEFFGGDNSRVTLLGAQGGAVIVDLLLHSRAKSLFHGAIMQSGTSWNTQYFQKSYRERTLKLAELVKQNPVDPKVLLEEFRNVPGPELLSHEFNVIPQDYFAEEQRNLMSFGPALESNDDGLIKSYPEDSKYDIDIPIMIGSNSREGIDSVLQYLIEPNYLTYVERSFGLNVPIRLNFRFDPEKDTYYEAVQDVKDFYFSEGKVKITKPSEYITYAGDILNIYAVDYAARQYANVSLKPVYYYHFDYSSELNENKMNLINEFTTKDGTWGAVTGDELCYLFKCPKLRKEYRKFNKTDSEEIFIQRNMIKMWTNFIKYGEPTPFISTDERLVWNPYTLTSKEYLRIGKKIEMKKNLYSGRFKFWDDFIQFWKKLAVDGVVTQNPDEAEREEL